MQHLTSPYNQYSLFGILESMASNIIFLTVSIVGTSNENIFPSWYTTISFSLTSIQSVSVAPNVWSPIVTPQKAGSIVIDFWIAAVSFAVGINS